MISPQLATLLTLAGVAIGYFLGLFFRSRLSSNRIIGVVSSHTTELATIVMKRRGRSGTAPIIYYMVGPVRYREKDAIGDLARWQAGYLALPTYKPPNTWSAPPPRPPDL